MTPKPRTVGIHWILRILRLGIHRLLPLHCCRWRSRRRRRCQLTRMNNPPSTHYLIQNSLGSGCVRREGRCGLWKGGDGIYTIIIDIRDIPVRWGRLGRSWARRGDFGQTSTFLSLPYRSKHLYSAASPSLAFFTHSRPTYHRWGWWPNPYPPHLVQRRHTDSHTLTRPIL